jgi:hypothetical protein
MKILKENLQYPHTALCVVRHLLVWDNMKKPATILVLQYWYTILVLPVFYHYLPVSAILVLQYW